MAFPQLPVVLNRAFLQQQQQPPPSAYKNIRYDCPIPYSFTFNGPVTIYTEPMGISKMGPNNTTPRDVSPMGPYDPYSTETSPRDTSPMGPYDPYSTDTSPMGTAPLGTAPLGTAPLGTAPVGTAPVGTAPVGTTPMGTTPIGTTPGDTTPVGTVPVGTVPVGTVSVGTTPGDTTPVGTAPVGNPPINTSPTSTPLGTSPRNTPPVETFSLKPSDNYNSPHDLDVSDDISSSDFLNNSWCDNGNSENIELSDGIYTLDDHSTPGDLSNDFNTRGDFSAGPASQSSDQASEQASFMSSTAINSVSEAGYDSRSRYSSPDALPASTPGHSTNISNEQGDDDIDYS